MCGDSGINERIESKPFYIKNGQVVWVDDAPDQSPFTGVINALLITLAATGFIAGLVWCGYEVFCFLKATSMFAPALIGLSTQRHEHRQTLLEQATDKRGWVMVGIVFLFYCLAGSLEVPSDL